MSYIKSIYAGDDIIIEDLGDDSVRIHNNYNPINMKLPLPSYFEWSYEQTKLAEGNANYYLHVKNCIFKINGAWHEIPDIYFSPSDGVIYDMYLRIQEKGWNESNAEKRLEIEVITYDRVNDEIKKPENPYDHHLFRFTARLGHMELIRMMPHVIDITCVKGGFLAYHDYQGVMVRNESGDNSSSYQGIPSYSEDQGAMLIETPIQKNGYFYEPKYLVYSGEDYIYLVDKL